MSIPTNPRVDVDVSGTMLEPPPGLDPDCLLFLGDPKKRTVSDFSRWWMPVSAAVVLGVGSLVANLTGKLPISAGVHRHIFNVVAGFGIGEGAWRFKMSYTAEKDIQYYHYMILHPEDFQAPERKKFADTIQPWIPIR